ncbi:putative quinol monooxygenase [Aspergillus homomorphus CBS 101889]|uniref:ABM domain-containing protein n=1 Tax=Aspergillus homomorphus (strain CBS 101889) TaxID=1450537 RepID=A0A395HRQ1_ASPHC|nr:hypothetical protein BO97DRAFT_479472 [Aspergillus homomorphus CBS 101889]RAL10246.1 hypothetical protein BO97DRAFT_479472 [Aspergillus homomorphus CBS 101889]
MASPSAGISLHVTVHISPENLPKFWEAMHPVYEKVIAEPECTFFEIYQSPENPGTLSWVENWSQSLEWLFEVQIKKPYYHDYLAVTEPMFIKPREVKIYNRVGAPYYMVKSTN